MEINGIRRRGIRKKNKIISKKYEIKKYTLLITDEEMKKRMESMV